MTRCCNSASDIQRCSKSMFAGEGAGGVSAGNGNVPGALGLGAGAALSRFRPGLNMPRPNPNMSKPDSAPHCCLAAVQDMGRHLLDGHFDFGCTARERRLRHAMYECLDIHALQKDRGPVGQSIRTLDRYVLPNFRTLAAATAAKSQNSAILLDSYRIVVLKIRCPSDEFSVLTGSATACWHSR